jgi:nitroreductase
MSDGPRRTDPFPSPLPPRAAPPTADPGAVSRLLRSVRQTRDFLPTPVPEAALRDILDGARWTGSAGNREPWTFIVVTDLATKQAMAKAATNTPHIGIAPVVVAVAMDPMGETSDNFDEGRVAERIMIAAAAHGISSGIGRAKPDAQKVIGPLLGVPEGHFVRTMVSLGYPTDEGRRPKSPPGKARKPLDELVRQERHS